ncbi:MAG: DUF2796 domain-containing protein [Alphaproteobacteria bacterium]|nr:DUF2796 domain-containing protein [Rhodospirillales bacterium]MCW9045284.1 DUF2796 domain-containing protein [Alphaproteobacteria bacterium]
MAEEQHQAHEHGVGKLNIAFEGQEIEIELKAPAADIVGFEHEPKTEKEKSQVTKAIQKLTQASIMFTFPMAAKCQLEKVEIESALQTEESTTGHKEHEHNGHDKHEHNEHDKVEVHSDFEVHYRFMCGAPKLVTYLDVLFFKEFKSAHELDVQYITPKGQGMRELTPTQYRLNF